MIGEYFDSDPRHGGIPSSLTVAVTQQHQEGSWDIPAKNSSGASPAGSTSTDCSWRPDLSYSTPKAKAWKQSDQQLNAQPLNLDANGMYTVQFGDCLSGIAARQLRGQGNANPNKDDIAGEIDQIVQDNHDRYQSLDCNTDLVKTGWKLLISSGGDGGSAAAPAPDVPVTGTPQEAPEQPVPTQQGKTCPDDGGDGGQTVNEYHINNAYFGANQGRWAPESPVDRNYDRGDWQQSVPQGDQFFQQQRPYAPYIGENPVWAPRNFYANPGIDLEFGLFPRHRYMPFPPMRPPFRHGGGGRFSFGIGIF